LRTYVNIIYIVFVYRRGNNFAPKDLICIIYIFFRDTDTRTINKWVVWAEERVYGE